MVVVRAWIILARSAVDGSAIGKEVEAAEAVDEAGVEGGVAVGLQLMDKSLCCVVLAGLVFVGLLAVAATRTPSFIG